MGKMTDNCTDTKAAITVKAVFDGTQRGQQAFMKLIRRQYRSENRIQGIKVYPLWRRNIYENTNKS